MVYGFDEEERQSEEGGAATMERPSASSDPLAEELREAVASKVSAWAENHPEPDEPVLASAGEGGEVEMVSPRDLAKHIERRTALGEEVVRNYVHLLVRNLKDTPLL